MPASGLEEDLRSASASQPPLFSTTVDEGIDEADKDFYAFLNVSPDCSLEEINAAKKRLALVWHPDRHSKMESGQSRDDARAHATAKFARLSFIVDVLSDPVRRRVYDLYGEKGLSSGMEVGAHFKTPEQVRAEYRRQTAKQAKKRLESKLGISGMLQASANLHPYLQKYLEPAPEVARYSPDDKGGGGQSVVLVERFASSLSRRDTLDLQGQLITKGGKGGSVVAVTLKRQFSSRSWAKLAGQIGLGVAGRPVAVTAWRALSSLSSAKISLRLAGIWAQLRCAAMRQLSARTSAKLQYIIGGPEAGVKMRAQRVGQRSSLTGFYWVGLEAWRIGAAYSNRVSARTSMSLNLNLGEGGPVLDVGCRRRISGNSAFSCHCMLSALKGVTLKLSLGRMGQDLAVPLLLANKVSLHASLLATLLPSLLATLAKVVWIGPRKRKRRLRQLQQLRQEKAEEVTRARREATSDVELMQYAVERKRQQEEERSGVIILKALFGRLDPAPERRGAESAAWPVLDETCSLEVSAALQYLLEDSRLQLFNSSKAGLPGFCDPCPGEDKRLYVLYRFKGRLHEVVVGDTAPLSLPLERHLLPPGAKRLVGGAQLTQPAPPSSSSSARRPPSRT